VVSSIRPSLLPLLRSLARGSQSYSTASQRLSSGLRINSSVDDPAGLDLQLRLDNDRSLAIRGKLNLNDTISALNIASSSINHLGYLNSRLKELTEQAKQSTLSSSQRDALQSEANALVDEFNRVVDSTKYNGMNLIN
jgi:flagellin